MTLHFEIKEQTVSLKRSEHRQNVVANSRNYLYAAFTLSEEWMGVITAVFEHPTLGAKPMLVGSDGSCLVPWEVIQPPCFYVGAFCGSRVTSNRAQVFVKPSVTLETSALADPTPSVYEQIITLLETSGTGGGIAMEHDPTVPAHVKGIQQADINRWNNPPTVDMAAYLTKTEAEEGYLPTGGLADYLSKAEAQEAYQPKGNYQFAGDYQPAGSYQTTQGMSDYLTRSDAATAYQPKGSYQPAGSYLKTTDTIDISRVRDASEDNTFGSEDTATVPFSLSRLFYYKSDSITNANNVFRTGAYGVRNTDTHMPYLQWWYLICFCKNEAMRICVQWAFPVRPENNGELWMRTCRGEENFYGAWKRVATTEQIDALDARIAALEAARG